MNELTFTGERYIPGCGDEQLAAEHLQRYLVAAELADKKCVLDVACGEGYGSRILASKARQVLGIDKDRASIDHACAKYSGEKISFSCMDICSMDALKDDSFDLVVSYETVEHLEAEQQALFLTEISRVLKPDGCLIMSTPNREIYEKHREESNEFHRHELSAEEFEEYLKQVFPHVKLYGQSFQAAGLLTEADTTSDTVKVISNISGFGCEGRHLKDSSCMIALASHQRLSEEHLANAFFPESNLYDLLQQRIRQLQAAEEDRNRHIQRLDQELDEKGAYIYQLQNELALKKMKRDAVRSPEEPVTENAEEKFVRGVLADCVRSPLTMARFFTPHRIRQFFRLHRMGGMSAVRQRYRQLEMQGLTGGGKNRGKAEEEKSEAVCTDVPDETVGRAEYPALTFAEYEEPLVTVIIPVFNQFRYTYACLKSIHDCGDKTETEIIIADDHSESGDFHVFRGVSVVENEGERGFLHNCNTAAAKARGKYILFLNNDTQVQPHWLDSLVEVMEKDPSVGVAGGKLLNPDGTLQEAGGIVWKDGSAWNYGRGGDPEDAAYNFLRETDYVSGAVLIIRRELWEKLGGFDPLYTPAYYEDTDLAFRVREAGYRVVYQPACRVIHFEGRSNGTSTETGLKSHQVTGREKFCSRWKGTLEAEHFGNGEEVFLARDRSRDRKHILVVDHYVPHYDRDAGGRCTFMWLKLFVRMGMRVIFIGDNFYKHEPYTSVLTGMGIEVLYGDSYSRGYPRWMEDNLKYFDYVYLQRPHIASRYMDLVRKYARGKIFYFAHDLHFLRLKREYELTGDKKILQQAEMIRKTEMKLFSQADVIHVVGSYEQQYLSQLMPGKTIRNIPLYLYEELPGGIEKDFRKRRDIIFVGGFGHPPNADAVLWFAKAVYPLIRERFPDICWHIVGSQVPEEIRKLDGEGIWIHGYLSDVRLGQLYRTCRLAVVPLRYGAGVKGKILEAACFQLPVVTTTVGGEGIPHEDCMAIEDDPVKMAELICELYADCGKLEAMSNAGEKLIMENYTMEAAEKVFLQDGGE